MQLFSLMHISKNFTSTSNLYGMMSKSGLYISMYNGFFTFFQSLKMLGYILLIRYYYRPSFSENFCIHCNKSKQTKMASVKLEIYVLNCIHVFIKMQFICLTYRIVSNLLCLIERWNFLLSLRFV